MCLLLLVVLTVFVPHVPLSSVFQVNYEMAGFLKCFLAQGILQGISVKVGAGQ